MFYHCQTQRFNRSVAYGFHDNPNAARAELSSLLGITDLKPTRSFTQSYITGPTRNGQITTPSKFKKRFKLLWLKDYIKKDS